MKIFRHMLKFLQQGPSQQGITASPAAQDSIQACAGKWQTIRCLEGKGRVYHPWHHWTILVLEGQCSLWLKISLRPSKLFWDRKEFWSCLWIRNLEQIAIVCMILFSISQNINRSVRETRSFPRQHWPKLLVKKQSLIQRAETAWGHCIGRNQWHGLLTAPCCWAKHP